MKKSFSKSLIALLALASTALAQQPAQNVRGVVTVVHTVEFQKLLERMRREHKGSIGAPGSAPREVINIATGLALDSKGHIITRLAYLNPQDKDEKISVTVDGQTFEARLIGVDCPTGFAILEAPRLKIELPEFASLASVPEDVFIFSVDVTPKTTREKIKEVQLLPSIKKRQGRIGKDSFYSKARGALSLRSDTLLSRSDGSVVATTENRVMGMAQYAGVGRAYLFTVDFLRDTVAHRVIEKQDSVASGWLGITGESLAQLPDAERAALGIESKAGVIVREVTAGGPGATGGILAGDVIVRVDDFDIIGTDDMVAKLSSSPAGHKARLRAIRNRKPMEIDVALGARSFTAPTPDWIDRTWEMQVAGRNETDARLRDLRALLQSYSERRDMSAMEKREAQRELRLEIARLEERQRALDQQRRRDSFGDFTGSTYGVRLSSVGLVISDLSPQLAVHFGAKNGVLIKLVVKGSAAERAGLKAGDVVVGADQREPLSTASLRSVFAYRKKILSLKVIREKQPIVIRFDNR
ncbi:MAG: PDZ domain-containing protein [Acidobacteriota bacterium]